MHSVCRIKVSRFDCEDALFIRLWMIKLPDTVVLHLQIPGNVCFLETITDKQIIIVIIKKEKRQLGSLHPVLHRLLRMSWIKVSHPSLIRRFSRTKPLSIILSWLGTSWNIQAPPLAFNGVCAAILNMQLWLEFFNETLRSRWKKWGVVRRGPLAGPLFL